MNCSLLKSRYDLGIAFSLQGKPCNFESWLAAAFVLPRVSGTMGLGAWNKLLNDTLAEREICLTACIFPSGKRLWWCSPGRSDPILRLRDASLGSSGAWAPPRVGVISSKYIFREISFCYYLIWGYGCNLHVAGFSCSTALWWLLWVFSQWMTSSR